MAAVPKTSSARLGASPEVSKFLNQIGRVTAGTESAFERHSTPDSAVTSISEAVQYLKRALHDKKARSEMESFTRRLGGHESPAFWDAYLRSYDKVIGFADGYLEMLVYTAKTLSQKGQILDVGAGTGNYSAQLLFSSPFRNVTAVDLSTEGLKIAREKARVICGGEQTRFQARVSNLRMGLHGLKTRFDGAVMGNVLSNLPVEERSRMLQQIFSVLSPGAEFVLMDPVPELKTDSAALERFLTGVVVDAVLNGSKLTASDIAIVAYMTQKPILENVNFLSARTLSDALLSAGFQIFDRRTSYYEMCSVISARRPVLSRK